MGVAKFVPSVEVQPLGWFEGVLLRPKRLANINKDTIHTLVILLESYTDQEVPCTIYLAQILQDNKSFEDIDHAVLSECFLSIYRHQKMLHDIVKYFYCSKKIRLHTDKSLLIVVNYILIFLFNKDTVSLTRELLLSVVSLSRALRLMEFYTQKNIINDLLKISCTYFDVDYVQNKVLKTILTDAEMYKDLLKELQKIKKREEEKRKQHCTVAITPNVLQHIKKAPPPGPNTPLPQISTVTVLPPPKSTYIEPNIALKLRETSKKNKEASLHLYNEAQENVKKRQAETHHVKHKCHCSTPSVKVSKKTYRQSTKSCSKAELPVKINAAYLLREAARIIREEETEIKKVEELTKGGANYAKFEKLMDEIRDAEETRQLQEIEKKHLQGLLTREEAILARQNLLLANKNKRMHFEEDRKKLKEELNHLKLVEEEKIKNTIEKTQQVQKNIEAKRKDIITQKQNIVQEVNETSRQLLEEAMRKRAEELSQRMEMIEEIRALSQLKEFHGCQFDPSETMNFGLFCEMSLTELQERLLILQIDLKEELEKKQEKIKRQRFKQQQFLIDTQEFIDEFRFYKKEVVNTQKRKMASKTIPCNEEILCLRKKLESARKKKGILLAQNAS